MALAISEVKLEIREIKLREKPEEMLAASPKGTVPVLVLEDGSVIDESIDVMRWALSRNDPEDWLLGDDRALIETIDGPFKHHLDRYKYVNRHDSEPEDHRAACLEMLVQLEARLTRSTYLCSNLRSMADAAIMPFVRQFAHTDLDWFNGLSLPRVQRWLAEFKASPMFQQIMVKRDQWAPTVKDA